MSNDATPTTVTLATPHHARISLTRAALLQLRRAALEAVAFTTPCVPVISNVTAEAMLVQAPTADSAADDAALIRSLLLQQLTAPVLWSECVVAATRPP